MSPIENQHPWIAMNREQREEYFRELREAGRKSMAEAAKIIEAAIPEAEAVLRDLANKGNKRALRLCKRYKIDLLV